MVKWEKIDGWIFNYVHDSRHSHCVLHGVSAMKYFNSDGFKRTSGNWSGNYRIANDARYVGGYVHVSYFPLGPKFDTYRVSVWGNDDTGMEFDTKDQMEAEQIYSQVMLMDDVTFDKLLQLDFVWA